MFRFDWDWGGAEREFNKAMELGPEEPYARYLYSTFLSALGRHNEALNEARRAQELDPVFLSGLQSVGIVLFFARRYDEAIEQFNKVIAMDPDFAVYIWLALTYIEKGMVEEALAAADKYAELISSGLAMAIQGYVYARAGKRSEAQRIAEQLVQYARQRYVPASVVALIYAGLGETDLALEWCEKAYEQRDPQMFRVKVIPPLDPLRSEPRFIAVLKKMGLEK
jgi:tetratricopeptide (TPR) repeat protein